MNKVTGNQSATKDDLKKLATRTDLKQVEKTLRGEILRVEERVEVVEEGMKELNEKVSIVDGKLDKLQNTLDGFVGVVDTLRTESEISVHHTREIQLKVKNHEDRISHLESSKRTV